MINETGKWILANEKSHMQNRTLLMRNKTIFAHMVYLGWSSGREGWRLEERVEWVLHGFSQITLGHLCYDMVDENWFMKNG